MEEKIIQGVPKIIQGVPIKLSHVQIEITREILTLHKKYVFRKLTYIVNCSNYFDSIEQLP